MLNPTYSLFSLLGEAQGGAILMALSGLACIAAFQVWLPARAFLTRWWWGIAVLVIPIFGILAFSVAHWQQARAPFLSGLVALGLATAIFFLRAAVAPSLS